MSKRNNRAGWALAALAASTFMLADFVGYGSDKGYNTELALGAASMFAAISVGLFAWNIATHKGGKR
jgi:hypothetical protein